LNIFCIKFQALLLINERLILYEPNEKQLQWYHLLIYELPNLFFKPFETAQSLLQSFWNCSISSSNLLKLPSLFFKPFETAQSLFFLDAQHSGWWVNKLANLGTLTLDEFSVSSRAMRLVVDPFQVSLLVPSSFMLVQVGYGRERECIRD
jgi:hypothetical protein